MGKPGSMTIQREYTMRCACCTDYEDFHEVNAKAAEKEARRQGWRKRPEGWVCPSCVASEELRKRAEKSKAKA